ncbi:hypothetical protein [Paraglaciecola sp.]|uniref:hypothetical protein n=1 Tax=Paraglaciecola sp. TaxID=1920173 RepID=UPI003EF45030
MFTAVLSVFYACREGYFYVQEQQQIRADKATYIQTADAFIKMDALDYAKQTLNKALILSPNDIKLQRRVFLLETDDWLRDLGWQGEEGQKRQLERLVVEGFRLLNVSQTNKEIAHIQLVLAQLLSFDQNWNDDLAITNMFKQANKALPNNPEALFQLGSWLAYSEIDQTLGLNLVKQAAETDKDNAIYWSEYAEIAVNQQQYLAGFKGFKQAIALKDKQRAIQAIRASNQAKTKLRQLLRQTDQLFDFSEGEFLGLSHQQRTELIELVAKQNPKDKEIAKIAVRYFYAQNNFEKAYSYIQFAFSKHDLNARKQNSDYLMFEKYKEVLIKVGKDPELQRLLSEQLVGLKDN